MAKDVETQKASEAHFRVSEEVRNTKFDRQICVILGILTLIVYLPTLCHDFLAYDDQEYVTQNWQVLRGLSWKGLMWAFGFRAANWHPLTWISHMLDCQVFGLRPWGHHLTNVLLHAANSVLLFVALRRLAGGQRSEDRSSSSADAHRAVRFRFCDPVVWPCAFVAALFAWHPLHVESVAWVAERKDVLSGLFFMLTLLAYERYARAGGGSVQNSVLRIQNRWVWYGWALLLFALGLMSKPMLVALPFVLLLLDYWPLGRLARGAGLDQGVSVQHCKAPALQLVLEKLPFFVLSGVGCVLTILAQQKGHAVVSTGGLPIPERIGHALVSYVHYLAVCFWPRHLSVFYPYENSGATEMAACALLLVAVTVAAVWVGRRLPYLLVGWFWFIGMLVPVIGLVQVGEQAWADRYMYLPSIGFLISAAWGVSDIAARKKPRAPNLGVQASSSLQISNLGAGTLAVLGGLVSLVAMAGTVVQLAYWRNTRTLFEHAEKVTRNNYMAIALVGSLQAAEGNPEDAIERYRRALEIRPGYAEAHYLLGDALEKQGRTEEAIAEYRQALRFKPIQFQAHISLGLALAKQHNDAEAAEHYRAALRINPDSAVAHNNLARLMHSQGKLDEAIEHYRAAIEYGPSLAEARNNLGAVLVQQGELPEGIAQLREALRINGGNSQTELNLALALCQQGDWSQAAELFARAAGKVPWDANLHYRFGVALEHNRKPKEAMGEYASALLMQPDFPDALAALAWVLATASDSSLRNGTEAVSMAERACDLTSRKDPDKLQVLAAAYAETGQFHEALSALTNARLEAVAGKNTDLIQKSERMDAAFRSGQPWRDLP